MTHEYIPELAGNIIYNTVDGCYVLFEKYFITKKEDYYVAYRHRDDKIYEFSSLRNAATWSILDSNNKIFESSRVLMLDASITSVKVAKQIHTKLQFKGDKSQREISFNKLQQDLADHRRFQYELDKYIILAKQCQQRGFENELKRTTRK
jgi:hypothetical protein